MIQPEHTDQTPPVVSEKGLTRTGLFRIRGRLWGVALLLWIPVLTLYAAHFFHGHRDPHREATGFIQYDMAYYLANAREYSDANRWHTSYGNPFSPFEETPRIYFQPLTWLLAAVRRLTGIELTVLFLGAGALASIGCIWAALRLFERQFGDRTTFRTIGMIAFVWGGGVLTVAGLSVGGTGGLFRFDPNNGWWFLNLGRNLIYPTEALYHLLVFVIVWLLLEKRFRWSITILAVLSISHPFTGVQFILIVLVWAAIERFYVKSRAADARIVGMGAVLLILYIAYYLVFLPSFPEHSSLMRQWALDWRLQLPTMALAYGPVLLLVLWRVRRPELAAAVFKDPANRLFLIWFIVSFGLANHEFAVSPIQPIHFTRGYIWIPLFLIGAPALLALFEHFQARFHGVGGTLAVLAVLCVLLADNAIWFAFKSRHPTGIFMTQDSRATIDWIERLPKTDRPRLVISKNPMVAYLAMVYTPERSWYSHWACTPFAAKRRAEVKAFFGSGRRHPLWEHWDRVFVEKVIDEASRLPEAQSHGRSFAAGNYRAVLEPAEVRAISLSSAVMAENLRP